jgi:SAM-dependent methyltransferase
VKKRTRPASFEGRPSASPVLAALFLAEVIRTSDAIVDFGCGDGTDSFALAAWGVRRVVGVDSDVGIIGTARRRLAAFKARHGAMAYGLDRITFLRGSVTERLPQLRAGGFDVGIDTLLWNNLSEGETSAYLQEAARLLRAGGLFVLQVRQSGHPFDRVPARRELPASFHRHFRMTYGVATHLAEMEAGRPAHAEVAVYLGRRRGSR